jgi:hypothetical protein
MKRAEVVATDVEGAVAIDEAGAAALGERAAETEILTEPFLLGRFDPDRGGGILDDSGPRAAHRFGALRVRL